MPIHYDPARIRVRFCPAGHDKYIEGVNRRPGGGSQCYKCDKIASVNNQRLRYQSDPKYRARILTRTSKRRKIKRVNDPEWRAKQSARTSNGWQNPLNAIRQTRRNIRLRRGRKIEQIKELLAQLKEGETNA